MKVFAISALICSLMVIAQGHHVTKHNPNGPVYDGLNSILDEAESHTQMFANDLTHRMNKTFNSIKEKIDQWKTNNAFTQQLQSLEADGNRCIKEHELTLAQFMRNLLSTYESCSQEVKQIVTEMLSSMKNSVSIIKNAPLQIRGIPEQCIPKENVNLAVSSLCVVTRVAEIQQATSEANLYVDQFINHGVEEIEAYAAQKCKGIKNLDKEFEEVYNKIQSCIQNKKQ